MYRKLFNCIVCCERDNKGVEVEENQTETEQVGELRRRPSFNHRLGHRHMRMMSNCIREIQAPVSDLCGLRSVMAEIPEESTLYHHAKVMNNCGTLLAEMIVNMKLYYTLSADLYEIVNSQFCLRREVEIIWESLIADREAQDKLSDIDKSGKKILKIRLNFNENVSGGLVESDKMCV